MKTAVQDCAVRDGILGFSCGSERTVRQPDTGFRTISLVRLRRKLLN
jgi:hypothetical protein